MPKPFFTRSLALTLCLGITTLAIGTEYDERSLATKKHFADLEYEAINEPFVGVRTADGI